MEMNTRLQVEHPVTEEITGEDLVEWQLRVASGEPLPKRQHELTIKGHAIEARLYAEDPAKGFLPSPGKIDHRIIPEPAGIEVRVDDGLNRTDVISPFYDPMIAKVIVHADTRLNALEGLERVCGGIELAPLTSNAGFLTRLLGRSEFKAGGVTTSFISEHESALLDNRRQIEELKQDAAVALLVQGIRPFSGRPYGSVASELSAPSGGQPWREALGFRLNQAPKRTVEFYAAGALQRVELTGDWTERWTSTEEAPGGLYVFDEGERIVIATRCDGTGTSHGVHDGEIEAPMPGKVTAVEVSLGETVAKGQRLLALEAMKMEHALTAPFDGAVAELSAAPGQQVAEGQLLVRLDAAPSES
jgi:3-methylcrotonyl-CoA carboxylase alpha subunit